MVMSKYTHDSIVILFFLMACGCTSEQLFHTGQEYQREQCRQEPLSKYKQCMEQVGGSYDAYKKDQQDIVDRE